MTKQTTAAAAVTVISIAVAIVVNLLTSGWSWTFFALLAVLAAVWVALAVWQVSSGRTKSLGAPVVASASGIVARPELSDRIVRLLLGSGKRKVNSVTGLWGPGGFGKTTLAKEICARDEIKAAFKGNIYWVEVGHGVNGAALADTINDVIKRIDGQSPGFTRPEQAGMHLGALLKERGRSLLAVDDIWFAHQLRPFLDAGRGCTLLVTTRYSDILPAYAEPVEINQMQPDQASALVNSGIADLPDSVRDRLLEITGRWPLALSLTNGALRRAHSNGADVTDTAQNLLRRLQDLGPTALDVTNERSRDRTVATTLESSLTLLGERRSRVLELAIFRDDTNTPRHLIALLWQHTAGLSFDEADRLCDEIVDMSLATGQHHLRLHDVIRSYLRHECGHDRLTALHNTFLDAVAATLPLGPRSWWELPGEQEHLWRTLAHHLKDAAQDEELSALVEAPAWLIGKLRRFGPVAVAEDVALVDNAYSRELTRFLDQLGHTLTPTVPEHAVVNALAHRLVHYPALGKLREAAIAETQQVPRLVPSTPMPDLPDLALNRVLVGHDSNVLGCAFSPTGEWLVTVGNDNAIRVWDPNTGRPLQVIKSQERLWGNCALSPDGQWLAVEGNRALVHVYDTATWTVHATLDSGGNYPLFVFLADSRNLVTANSRKQLTVWDVPAKTRLRRFKVDDDLDHCVALSGTTLLGIDGGVVRLWDVTTEKSVKITELTTRYRGCVVDPGHRWVTLVSREGLVVLDLTQPNRPAQMLKHHTDLTAAAFSPRGDLFATADKQGMITVWSAAEWRPIGQIAAHGSEINALAFSPDGSTLASASDDKTTRLWNHSLASGQRQQASVTSCAALPDGSWLAYSTQKSTIIHNLSGPEPETKLEFAGELASARGDSQLLVNVNSTILLCDARDWNSSQMLENPGRLRLMSITAGGSYVCAANRIDWLLWDVDTSGVPRYLVVEGESIRLADRPAPDTTRRSIPLLNRKATPEIIGASVAPSGDRLAVSFRDTIFVLSPATGELITTVPVGHRPRGARFSPDGRSLLVGAHDHVEVWGTDTWTHQTNITGFSTDDAEIAWTPDNSLAAVVAQDQVVRVYDTANWTCLTTFRLDGTATDCVWVGNADLVVVGGHGVYRFDFCAG